MTADSPAGSPASVDGVSTDALADARKALRCLYIAVDESVARDVYEKVDAALRSLSEENARLTTALLERECEAQRLRGAVKWALGEEGEFADLPEGRHPGDGKKPRVGRWYWRTELRSRAFGRPASPAPGETATEDAT